VSQSLSVFIELSLQLGFVLFLSLLFFLPRLLDVFEERDTANGLEAILSRLKTRLELERGLKVTCSLSWKSLQKKITNYYSFLCRVHSAVKYKCNWCLTPSSPGLLGDLPW
jgi:hypothetical protein